MTKVFAIPRRSPGKTMEANVLAIGALLADDTQGRLHDFCTMLAQFAV
jgi:hypothetical protein